MFRAFGEYLFAIFGFLNLWEFSFEITVTKRLVKMVKKISRTGTEMGRENRNLTGPSGCPFPTCREKES
jgi:hypothetical protein